MEELVEDGPELGAGQEGAEAEVGAAAAEADVRVRVATEVEAAGVGEDVLVAVGRGIEQHDPVALVDLLAPQQEVAPGRAAEVDHRRRPADELFHRRPVAAGEVVPQPGALTREPAEAQHGVADGVASGVVAGHRQQHEEGADLVVGETLPVDLGLHQPAHEVVGGSSNR